VEYTPSSLPEGRQRLVSLVRQSGDVIHVADAARVLGVDGSLAAKTLARWTNQGWLRRVGRGAYLPASLESLASEHVLDDPWVLVPALFSPAYVGGRTAAQHWDLTEQIFNDVCVFTTQSVREKSQIRHGVPFTLKHIDESRIFGTTTIWRGNSKVLISDPHRTIIDMLNEPAIGGGIQQVADCLSEYFKRQDRDDEKLIVYATRLGNGAVFKRLGFLAEGRSDTAKLIAACADRLSKGNAQLDTALESPRLISRWKLWVPSFWVGRND
jgi:predicted transcriptional regulator of viral defense system